MEVQSSAEGRNSTRIFTLVVKSLWCRIVAAAILGAALVAPSQALGPRKSETLSEGAGRAARLPRPHVSAPNSAVGIDHFSHGLTTPPLSSIGGHAAIFFAGSMAVVPGATLVTGGEPMPNSFYLGMMEPAADRLPLGAIARGKSSARGDLFVAATRPFIAVPVPEAWAMILVGIGLVGIRLRRKSRLAGARHFT
jgi:PEP-CTERM motif-containing protein